MPIVLLAGQAVGPPPKVDRLGRAQRLLPCGRFARIAPALIWLAAATTLLASPPQEDNDDELDQLPYGVLAEYQDGRGQQLQRVDAEIHFPAGSRPLDRRLSEGPYQVRWTGLLQSQARGEYRFYAYLHGTFRMTLGDQVLFDVQQGSAGWVTSPAIDLPYDLHSITAVYSSAADGGQLKLFWSGPQFSLEPIGWRQWQHDQTAAYAEADAAFERGRQLVRALRCAACHEITGEPKPLPAPALNQLRDNLHPQWVVPWLQDHGQVADAAQLMRRMPYYGLTADEARALGDYLILESAAAKNIPLPKAKPRPKKKNEEPPPSPDGRQVLLTAGCLACHTWQQMGQSDLFAGGDLTAIAAKRPESFFARWLLEPAAINADHRMPVFDLDREQLVALQSLLAEAGAPATASDHESTAAAVERGRQLFAERQCQACHRGPEPPAPPPARRSRLQATSAWQRACSAGPPSSRQDQAGGARPWYRLPAADVQAIQSFIRRLPVESTASAVPDGQQLLLENNCRNCHARDDRPGLEPVLLRIAEQHPQLAEQVPAMMPPPLISVGDKLLDRSLRDVINGRHARHRPYLHIQMPRFPLSEGEQQQLVQHLIDRDRIPDNAPAGLPGDAGQDAFVVQSAGSRLVTSDGFGCTSCHAVGDVQPPAAPLNAKGPDLLMMGDRIRRPWYDRWVRNPARIVPRMEMPSVQLAVRGVLEDDLDRQLAAVWDVLNQSDFRPPLPNPVRTLRHTGLEPDASRPLVVTDVIRHGPRTYIKPLLIGLGNRHNVLFDLETAQLADWLIGDTAWQRTEGKTWFWELAGRSLMPGVDSQSEFELLAPDGRVLLPEPIGQFVTEYDQLEHVSGGIAARHRLQFRLPSGTLHTVHLQQTVRLIPGTIDAGASDGWRRELAFASIPKGFQLLLRIAPEASQLSAAAVGEAADVTWRQPARASIDVRQPESPAWDPRRRLIVPTPAEQEQAARVVLDYRTPVPVDHIPLIDLPADPLPAEELHVVPGFEAIRLPFSETLMPTALAWRPDGSIVIASLKGRVWTARDTDQDGLEDQLLPFSDELAAPYGLSAHHDYIDVVNKSALLRLFDTDRDGHAERTETLVSGWGHTQDYHDWTVGLPQDREGRYFVATACQQDERSAAAARYRGQVLRLDSRQPTPDNPQRFAIHVVSRGHRFPMGIALNRDGQLFVTDNQGNYNPFNELNHVIQDARYGFINAIEKQAGIEPASLTPPAINIPHPWTRSVNGICFLEGPASSAGFGPYEGHLVGCEYDTRRLIRMTLQRVGDVYQGAAYPFSWDEPPEGEPLLGPLVCAVAPDGDLYVGCIRDSGWGGANNIGTLVRLRMRPEQIPAGIAEVRATPAGFAIQFTRPVDRQRAADKRNYTIASYTRISTPAYGGEDQDRRSELIRSLRVSDDGSRVELQFESLRAGYVYELQLKNLTGDDEFFPSEAYYTLQAIPGAIPGDTPPLPER